MYHLISVYNFCHTQSNFLIKLFILSLRSSMKSWWGKLNNEWAFLLPFSWNFFNKSMKFYSKSPMSVLNLVSLIVILKLSINVPKP